MCVFCLFGLCTNSEDSDKQSPVASTAECPRDADEPEVIFFFLRLLCLIRMRVSDVSIGEKCLTKPWSLFLFIKRGCTFT